MPSEPRPAGGDRRLGYIPGLDGLRGVAVAAVLLYHGGFGWARGGFLGVSTFFTLSGFLITTLLLADRSAGTGVRLGAFYRRRARRLLPASLLTLLLVLVYGAVVAGPTEQEGLSGDVLATLAQVTNWRFVLEGRSYGDLFSAPSLLQHAWSLAIEEQFYLLFPPAFALLVRRRWGIDRMLGAVVGLAAIAAVATGVLIATGADSDRLYFGTDTRAIELLAGVVLALVIARSDRPLAERAPVLALAGSAGLVVSAVAWVAVEQSSPALYRGGLAAYALASVAVVAACLVPGPVSTLLSVRPLRGLGQISYGLYLFHWPVFRWLSPERLDTSRTVAFLIATPVSVALATLSSTLLETPIRQGRLSRPRSRPGERRPPVLALVAAGTAALVVAGALLVPTEPAPIDIDATAAEFDRLAREVPVREGAPVIGVFGDSTATAMALGLAQWAQATGKLSFGPGMTELGCGIIIHGEIRYGTRAGDPGERCEEKDERYSEAAAELDLAVVQYGPWDVADHQLPLIDGWRTVGDETYDAALIDEALRLIDILTAEGAVVLWIQPPLVRLGTVDGRPPAEPFATSDPDRMRRFREIGEELAAARPDTMRLIDLAGWMADLPGGELTPDLRPDGVHLTEESALYVADEFLGPAIEEAWAEVRDRRGS